MTAILRTVRGFAAWGHQYNGGDPIPAERVALWAPGTLETRLENGDVTYDSATPEEAAQALLGPGAGVVLVAVNHFSAFGVEYNGGDIIHEDEHAEWPEGTVVTRLMGGDVKYVVDPLAGKDDAGVKRELVEDPELKDEDDEDEGFDIDKATKARMVSYAKSEFDADLRIQLDKSVLKAQLQDLINIAAKAAETATPAT